VHPNENMELDDLMARADEEIEKRGFLPSIRKHFALYKGASIQRKLRFIRSFENPILLDKVLPLGHVLQQQDLLTQHLRSLVFLMTTTLDILGMYAFWTHAATIILPIVGQIIDMNKKTSII
ncbi:hypothetical protein ACJX0J_027814, partial [Zea mays]